LAAGGGAADWVCVPSRATVTRGLNRAQSLALSLAAIRTGIGLMHWKRVEGSKNVHCLQQCSSALHFGQVLEKSGSCDVLNETGQPRAGHVQGRARAVRLGPVFAIIAVPIAIRVHVPVLSVLAVAVHGESYSSSCAGW
jgi:hypothetical protein